MKKKRYKRSLFIFRRDLRLSDNLALVEASKASHEVIVCFIFDPRQVGKNPYRGDRSVQFMLESLDSLSKEIKDLRGKLFYLYGKAEEVVQHILRSSKIDAIFLNRDYTPFSITRDNNIEAVAKRFGVDFVACADLLLTKPGTVLNGSGKPYTVFTHFFKKALTLPIAKPIRYKLSNLSSTLNIPRFSIERVFPKSRYSDRAYVRGGRTSALNILSKISKFHDYAATKDFPAHGTTSISPHIKFGTVSIREVYYKIRDKLGVDHPLIRQLYWRDFFTHIAYHFPHVFGHSFNKRFDRIKWSYNKKRFAAWSAGLTGLPLVDAGMRQLNLTGYMPNRVRMVVASFLVKDLHIDWRWGERYFAQKLIDYDPSVNNGNWQWVASTGCDAQPHFRIFNPWLQQKRFDPKCNYIKRWVPELKGYSAREIHNLYVRHSVKGYPKPIVNHVNEKVEAEEMYLEL